MPAGPTATDLVRRERVARGEACERGFWRACGIHCNSGSRDAGFAANRLRWTSMNGASRRLRFPRRVTVGIALAALLCLWGSLQAYEVESAYQQQYADAYSVSVQVNRLAPLLAAVPQSGILGYL